MNTSSGRRRWRMLLAALLSGAGCLAAHAEERIHGAGATFPAPLYVQWGLAYRQASGVALDYDAVGSGAGIERVRRHEVDFSASDAPLAAPDLAAAGLMQFPVVIGGIVPVINIRGIKPGELRLTGAALAEIYLGHVRKWNERAIAELNPTLELPNANIEVVHRSDASGSSMIWTDYLSRSSDDWRARVGASLTPAWPVGVAAAGNEGVASQVLRTRFAIGYVEHAYARAHRLADVALRNREGQVVRAGSDAFRAAAAAAEQMGLSWFSQLPTDLPGAASWPITGSSFILIPTAPAASAQALAALKFFDWALHGGEATARELDYVPVPRAVIDALPALWRRELRDPGGNALWR